jgi:hypothetical protein
MSSTTLATPDPWHRPPAAPTAHACGDGVSANDDLVASVRRPEDQWSFRGSDRGRAVHQLIGELLATTRRPSSQQITRTVATHDLLREKAVIHRQSIKQPLETAIACYFARFAPCELWDFAGASVRLGSCEFDLLWRASRNGRLLADELKTGLFGLTFVHRKLDRQVERQLQAGTTTCGDRFAGVRAIVLGEPWRSFLARPDGSRQPLQWEVV